MQLGLSMINYPFFQHKDQFTADKFKEKTFAL